MAAESALEWLSQTLSAEARSSGGVVPQPASEAAYDDAYLKPYDTLLTDLVTFRLRSAWDHLQALMILLGYATPTAPFAPYSLARGALVSAGTAYWLISGDAVDRRRNALDIHREDARRDLQFLESNFRDRERGLNEVEAATFGNAIQVTRANESRAGEARLILMAGAPSRRHPKALPREIDLVASAQPALDAADVNIWLRGTYMRLSGVIHVLPWASKRNRHCIEELSDGRVRYRHVADRDELLGCGKAVAHIAIAARRRLTELCSKSS